MPIGPERQINKKIERPVSPDRERQIQEFLTRGVDAVYPTPEALAQELRSGRKLTAYMGIDPTAPDMHVGHQSQLHKLRRLQDMGHHVVLLIGDFTAMIGDPTDKSATRVRLTREQVLENATSYKQQASKILQFDHPENPVELKYNSEWLSKLTFEQVLELASSMSVQQMEERDMFQKRIKEGKPVWLHEFLYPLMQGYDSVAMDVDIEIGGSDQTFNMMVGRDLVKRQLGKSKFVVAGSLLADPSGKKIGKTEGNMITMTDTPDAMFHKIMTWGDGIVPHALELCTNVPMDEINKIAEQMKSGKLDGLEAKKMLARTLVSELHSGEQAKQAETGYDARVSKNKDADLGNIQKAYLANEMSIIDLLVRSGLTTSRSAARRLLADNGVRIDGETITDIGYVVSTDRDGAILQVGKKKADNFRKVVFGEPTDK